MLTKKWWHVSNMIFSVWILISCRNRIISEQHVGRGHATSDDWKSMSIKLRSRRKTDDLALCALVTRSKKILTLMMNIFPIQLPLILRSFDYFIKLERFIADLRRSRLFSLWVYLSSALATRLSLCHPDNNGVLHAGFGTIYISIIICFIFNHFIFWKIEWT